MEKRKRRKNRFMKDLENKKKGKVKKQIRKGSGKEKVEKVE